MIVLACTMKHRSHVLQLLPQYLREWWAELQQDLVCMHRVKTALTVTAKLGGRNPVLDQFWPPDYVATLGGIPPSCAPTNPGN